MSIRKRNRWALRGAFTRTRSGESHGGVLSRLIALLTSLGWCMEIEKDELRILEREAGPNVIEQSPWRERAAMLERNLDEGGEAQRPSSRWAIRRRRRAAPGFDLGKVRWGRVSKITADGIFVRINGVDWPVCVPELSWGDVQSPLEITKVGRTIGVKTLSTPAHAKHPFLVLV